MHGSSGMPMMQTGQDGNIQVTCPYMTQGQGHMRNTVNVSYMGSNGMRFASARVMGNGRNVSVSRAVLCRHAAQVKVSCTIPGGMHSQTSTLNRRLCRQ